MRGKIAVSIFVLMLLTTACNKQGNKPMTAKFQILQPKATENLILSPSLEGAALNFPIPPFGAGSVLGWETVGSALALSTNHARFGTHSLEIVTAGAVVHEGTYFRMQPNTGDTKYTGSVYLRGEGRVRVRLVDMPGTIDVISDPVQLSNDRWVRVQDLIGGVGAVSNDLRLYVETVNVQSITFYVDGAQVEEGTRSTTFCDGDQDGCKWNGIFHASTSKRSSQERSGGYFVGLDEESAGIYVTVAGGVGMPPVRHNLLGRALLPGVEFQSTKILPRVIQLTIWAKDSNASTLKTLHEKRQFLIDLISPGAVSPTQPFVLRYNGGSFPVDIECYYEAGLEFSGDMRNPMYNSFVMRMLCTDPFWIEDNQESEEIGFSRVVTGAESLLKFVDGEWQDWGFVKNDVLTVVEDPTSGRIYIGGYFNNIDSVPGTSFISYWDGENWNALTNGLNDSVATIAIAHDGRVYAGGEFTAEGGGGPALQRIGVWDPVTETWAALGAGLNNQVNSIDISANGQVYVGGLFNDVQGGIGNTLNRIARWNPFNGTWNSMGAGPGVAARVLAVAVSQDNNTVYIGGLFTEEFGGAPNTLLYIASYSVVANTFTQLSTGADDDVFAVSIAFNGDVYVGGSFTTIGGISASLIARWNGTAFNSLGDGVIYSPVGGTVYFISISGNLVFVGGWFDTAGDMPLSDAFAVWNGSSWLRYPVDFPPDVIGLDSVNGVVIRDGDVFLGGRFGWWAGSSTAITGETTTINNPGSHDVKPIIEIDGPGIVIWLENWTTGDVLYLNNTLGDGEHLTIDLEGGTVISNWRGSVIGEGVMPQSNFATFRLLPGDNTLIFYIANDGPNTNAQIRFVPQHLSVDGTIE